MKRCTVISSCGILHPYASASLVAASTAATLFAAVSLLAATGPAAVLADGRRSRRSGLDCILRRSRKPPASRRHGEARRRSRAFFGVAAAGRDELVGAP